MDKRKWHALCKIPEAEVWVIGEGNGVTSLIGAEGSPMTKSSLTTQMICKESNTLPLPCRLDTIGAPVLNKMAQRNSLNG